MRQNYGQNIASLWRRTKSVHKETDVLKNKRYCPPIQQWAPASSSMGRRGPPQDSLTHCMMQRANRQANPSAGKEHKRFRLQTFAQPEYAVFDETLVWCALGSATGGKHVSAISHSSNFPFEIS